jgi:hypothetical protein
MAICQGFDERVSYFCSQTPYYIIVILIKINRISYAFPVVILPVIDHVIGKILVSLGIIIHVIFFGLVVQKGQPAALP